METPIDPIAPGSHFEVSSQPGANSSSIGKENEKTFRLSLEQKEEQIRALTEELKTVRAQLQEESNERERWAQYLHDAVTQSLFSAGLIAEVLPRLWERDQAAARKSLEDLRRLTFGAIGEMRVLLVESRPALLRETEFGDLLILLGNVLAGRLNIPVHVQKDEKLKLPEETQYVLYRLCKEVLNRIIQRARANEAALRICRNGSATEIHITENGDIFEAPRADGTASKEFLSILERAESMGITLSFGRLEDNGTDIVICLNDPAKEDS